MDRPVVLLTGASSGLGLSLARLLIASNKYHLVLTARQSSLKRFLENGIMESEFIWIRPLDVIERSQRIQVINEVNNRLNGVDILINNAGFTYRAVLEHVTEDDRLNQMEINFRAPMELIRLALPKMREKRCGKIINISSVGGMMAMPTMAIYSASKFALEGASEALWYELKPFHISVSLIQPGFIHSNSYLNTKLTDLSKKSTLDPASAYYAHYYYMRYFIEKMMKLSPFTPEKIAKKIFKVILSKNPPLRISGTLDATIFKMLRKFLPERFYHWILYISLPHIKKWGKLGTE